MQKYLIVLTALAVLGLSNGCQSNSGTSSSPTNTPTDNNNGGDSGKTPQGPGPVTETWPANAKDALATSAAQRILQYHSPYGLVYTAMYKEPGSKELYKWETAADSALWTGVYLAAQSFWYRTTKSAEAQAGAIRTIEAMRKISLITGDGLLARHVHPVNSPTTHAFLQDNGDLQDTLKGTLEGVEYYYLTRTSRDQYAGAYFGLGVAYDMLDDAKAKETIKQIVTRLTDYLLDHGWNTLNPDGSIRTTFLQRPDQQLSIMQVARHVNPAKFEAQYFKMRSSLASKVWIPLWAEGLDRDASYFKFNLNHLYMYNLMRLEEKNSDFVSHYQKGWDNLVESVAGHKNAHFDIITTAIYGKDAARDAETIKMLDQLWAKGFKRTGVDVRGKYKECSAGQTCDAVPVNERSRTDFIWQSPPWDTYIQSDERFESAGVDYLITYWMSRYYRIQ